MLLSWDTEASLWHPGEVGKSEALLFFTACSCHLASIYPVVHSLAGHPLCARPQSWPWRKDD